MEPMKTRGEGGLGDLGTRGQGEERPKEKTRGQGDKVKKDGETWGQGDKGTR